MQINVVDWTEILPDGSNLPAEKDWWPYDVYNIALDFKLPSYKPGYFIRLMWWSNEATHFKEHIKRP